MKKKVKITYQITVNDENPNKCSKSCEFFSYYYGANANCELFKIFLVDKIPGIYKRCSSCLNLEIK